MARASGGGSRFASANLNDLYGKQVQPGGGGSGTSAAGGKSRYAHGVTTHGGMLVFARPVRTPPGRPKPAPPKLTVPAPVNLPSLRKEHAGNDPNITLVGGSGVSGWSKQQQQALVEDPAAGDGSAPLRSNGWGVAQPPHSQQESAPTDGQLRPGKYTPPGARGNTMQMPIRPAPPPVVVLRGEDFPTLQAAVPLNPVPPQQRQRELQQRQREKQQEIKQQQQKMQQLSQSLLEKEQGEDRYAGPAVLALQPQAKQEQAQRFLREEPHLLQKHMDADNQFPLKENRKPSDVSLRPGPLLHLNHTSNWADDERETASMSKPPDWEEGPRFSTQAPSHRPTFQRDDRLDRIGNARRDAVHSREGPDYGRSREIQEFGYREGYFGRNDFGRDRNFRSEVDAREFNGGRDSRGNGWGRDVQRERDGYANREGSYNRSRESFGRDSFFNKTAGDRGRFAGRNGAFDLPMDFGRIRSSGLSHGMSYSEDAFMRNFPELPNLDFRPDLKAKLRRKKEELNEAKFCDPERESFETELQRVQKEQEQERQRKIEERERAIELARKEQEERDRLAREEEERQRRLEEEAREAAARAEQEALESSRKIEEAKRAREEEKRRMLEEEEKRKENARRKLIELEERIAKREIEKKQNNVEGLSHHEVADRDDLPTKGNTYDLEDDDRAPLRFARPMSSPLRSRVQQDPPTSRLRSPDVQGSTYNTFSMGRESGSRGGDSERPRFSSSWRREPGDAPLFPNISQDRADGNHSSVLRDHRLSDEAERFYGSLDGFSPADGLRRDRMSVEKWIPNGDPMRNLYPSRTDAFMDHNFLEGSFNREEDRRWNRRARDGRPFSPPSPTAYGGSYDSVEGFSYGRVRQSLPKQPRVPPPPLRIPLQRQSSSKIAERQSASSTVFSSSDVQDNISGRGSETQPEQLPANVQSTERNVVEEIYLEDEGDSSTVPEVEEDTDLQGESESVVTTQLSFSQAFTSSVEEHNDKEQEAVSDSTASIEMSEEEIAEIPAVEKHVVEIGAMDEGDGFSEDKTTHLQNSEDKFDLETEIFEEEESMDGRVSDAAEMGAELSELVDSLVVLQKGEDEQVSQLKIVDSGELEESKREEELVKDEVVAATQPQKPVSEPPALLPSPLQTTLPGPPNGQHHTFHQQAGPTYVPSQFPLLEPRPRLQSHPDRPMTLQFGLLPGTSLLQGSVSAIQIGSIQMPLQLHPPMGHHVTHLQPPQFQFGQIGQQTSLLQSVPSFTVHHPQPMLQRPILNMDGQPTPHSQQGFSPQHFQTFWAHQFGPGNHGQAITDEKNALFDKDEKQSTDAMDGTSQDRKAQLEPVHLAVPKTATDELTKVESSAQDSWRAYSDGQVSTTFGAGFQGKGNAKQWPLQARKSGPQEAHFSSDTSFRRKPNRRGNSDYRSPNAERSSHYVPRRTIKVDDNTKDLQVGVDNMFPREVGKAKNLEKNGSVEGLFEVSDVVHAFEQPGGRNDEDDFIEVRSKRQMLNDRREQKEKQVKGKPKYMKVKEQATSKQRNVAKPVSQVGSSRQSSKNESSSLQNSSLDVVVTTARTTQVTLPNPEVVFAKSPQPSLISPLVSDAPSYPSLVAESQNASPGISAAPAAWGFNRANPEVVSLTQIQLEEAMKPVRFEVPIPQQLPEHLSPAVGSVALKDKGPGPAAAPGPINSLLAGEKIQFGAVTMPAYVSSITWPLSSSLGAVGSSRSEGFLAGRKELPQDENELASFNKGKRSRENDDGNSNSIDAEAEAEAAASAIAVAAISNDDYVHNADQHVSSHGVIGSASANKSSPVTTNGMAVQNPRSTTPSSGMDDTMSVSLPADLSVDPPLPLRGPPHSGQLLPSIPGGHSSFPGMGTILGGPVFAFSSAGDNSRDSGAGLNTERPLGPNVGNWQPHHSGADSFYGGPPSYTGPFINHGPIPSIPPHTLVYTSPFGGVGQFGQLGVSYMGPTQMPSVKQPDWKHTPVSATNADAGGLGGGMPFPQHNNRHLGHDPSVIPVVPHHGPFDVYRDMAFQVSNVDLAMQSQWSHMPGPHLPSPPMSGPIPGFPMQLRHPPPVYHMHQHTDCVSESNLTSAAGSPSVEPTDQFPDELGLGDSISLSSDAGSSFVVQQTSGKTPSLVSSLPAGSKLRSRVVLPEVVSSRPSTGSTGVRVSVSTSSVSSFQSHQYAATVSSPRRAIGHADKRNSPQQGLSKMAAGAGPVTGWSSQGRKGGGSQGRSQVGERGPGGEKSNAPAAKLKQVYVAKTSSLGLSSNDSSSSEIFTAEARHM